MTRVAALLIAGLLLVTAALKVVSPAESATLAAAYNIPPLLTAVVVHAELALAALLLFGLWPRKTLLATAAMFGFFGAFSIYRGWAGYESCGCFGAIKVNPWLTAALDGSMLILAAWAAWRSPAEYSHETKRFYLAGGVFAFAGTLAAAGMIAQAPGSTADVGGLVILEPETWVGKPFPLATHLAPERSFDEGRWTVLLYHHDCPHCQEAVPQYERLATDGNDRRVVLIETPPYGVAQSPEGAALRARLSDAREWFVQTPVEIRVDEGIVVSASLDLPSVAEQPLTFSSSFTN